MFIHFNRGIGGDENGPVHGFVKWRLTAADFTNTHGNSTVEPTEGCFAAFGNLGTSVEGKHVVPLRELA